MKRNLFCLVVVLLSCCAGNVRAEEDRAEGTVYLGPARQWRVEGGSRPWTRILIRELARQSFLIAARDELGLVTHDAWLGEAMPPEGDKRLWDITTTPDNPVIVELVRGAGPERATLVRHEVRRVGDWDYRKWVREMEAISRTKFVDALRQAGLQGRPHKREASVAAPERVEAALGEMNFLAQFRALREVHGLIQSQGESPALLGALVRGYANLGVLSEYYWHPAHKVFKARALLYAQRMAVQDQQSPAAEWHWAYAAALAGWHALALADLQEADKAWDGMAEKERPARPAWLALIGPFCRYEVESLGQRVGDLAVGQLAALLKYLAVEQAGCRPWAVQTAVETLPLMPECYRISDGLCEFVGVGTGHSATSQAVRLAGEKLYGRVESMPGLPEEIRRAAKRQPPAGPLARLFGAAPSGDDDEFQARRQLTEALLKTGQLPAAEAKDDAKPSPTADLGEPNWAALGILIRELSFMQVYRRAHFERYQLSVPSEDWLAAAAPLVEGHPCRVFLETFAWDADKLNEALKRLTKLDFVGQAYPVQLFYDRVKTLPDEAARNVVYNRLIGNQDEVARDLVVFIRWYAGQQSDPGKDMLERLLKASPYSPLARGLLVQYHWDDVQDKVAEWDKAAAQYPGLASTFAQRYTNLGRWDDAERCLKGAIKIVPSDLALYRQLGAIYQQQGQTDRWLATLEEYLKQPDYGLEHFSVQSEIAYHFMNRRQWQKALPYAEGAAECYSGWGLRCAAACYEGLQRWDKAEEHFRACSQRYDSESLDWYLFCRRTGQGQLEKAREFARAYVEKLAGLTGKPGPYRLIMFHLLEEQPEKALSEMEKTLGKNLNADDAVWMALIADQLKDAKKRDTALNRARVLAGGGDSDTETPPNGVIALVNLVTKDLAQGGEGKIDPAAADKISRSLASGRDRFCFHFAMAHYCRLHGRPEDADRYAKRCMGWTTIDAPYRTLAGAILVDHGVKPAEYRSLLEGTAEEGGKPKSAE
jgi:tetratricopeptide (TPR) repeat protein